jgi:hypothetical protein
MNRAKPMKRRPLITFADFSDPVFRTWYETNHGGPIEWDEEDEDEPEYGSSDYCY